MSLWYEAQHWAKYSTNHATDIGGGSVPNGTRNSLARIPLRWMLRECFKLNIGILFHREMFKQVGMDPARLYPHVFPRPPPVFQAPSPPSSPGTPNSMTKVPAPKVVTNDPTIVAYSDGGDFVSEELEDLNDATCQIFDQLSLKRVWWALELIPQPLEYQHDDDDTLVKQSTYVASCLSLLPR